MRTRTLAREAALQYLYEVDIVGPEEAEDLGDFLARQVGRADARPYAARLVAGVLEHKAEIDTQRPRTGRSSAWPSSTATSFGSASTN
jgi:transcription termination factor NusB